MWVAGLTHVMCWRQSHSVSGKAKTETLSAPSTNLDEKKNMFVALVCMQEKFNNCPLAVFSRYLFLCFARC